MTAPQDDEFGPWIEWGYAVAVPRGVRVGDVYQAVACLGFDVFNVEKRVENNYPECWARILRFRIKRPRALLDLIQLIADLPAPVAPIKTDGVIA